MLSVPIDLDLGDPPRDIYTDLTNLPNPCKLGISVRAYNYDDVGLYFKVAGSGGPWTFVEQTIGLIASGGNAYRNFDQFGSRAKPSCEMSETMSVILRAYTDSGYTNLKWTFTRTLSIYFIDSSDPSYTVDVLNNFDDGTVQGWAAYNEAGMDAGYPQVAVATDYVLSPAYSLKMTSYWYSSGAGQKIARLYKSLSTPNRDFVYAIIDVRVGELETDTRIHHKNLRIQNGGTPLIHVGRPYDTDVLTYIPLNKWMRIVVPLPKNASVDMRIILEWYVSSPAYNYTYVWIDDFKVISK